MHHQSLPTGEPSTDPPMIRQRATAADYVAMARPDHWPKHVFILPGIVLAYILHPTSTQDLLLPIVLGFIAACVIASANYILNEWLDLASDRFHPIKSQRPAVQKDVSSATVIAIYVVLSLVGLGLGAATSPLIFATLAAFLASGVIYNVRPLRTKDRAYLDVASEAINNPIRLTLGWAMVWPEALPPSSLLLAYWMGGAFLMAVKRFAEYRSVVATAGLEALRLYRRSFRNYTENRLLVSAFLYAQMAAFFLAVFLIKYRVEYLLALPLFALLFAVYLRLGLKHDSTAQAPERLFSETLLMVVVGLLVIALGVLTFVDIPALEKLSEPHYLGIPD